MLILAQMGGTLPPRCSPAHASTASGTRVQRLSPGTHRACDHGLPGTPYRLRWRPERGGCRAGTCSEARP